jgi:hypothetical protein
MLDMYKYILGKVSFDKNIFKKELNKAVNNLPQEEAVSFIKWCKTSFDAELLNDCIDVEKEKLSQVSNSAAA